MSRTLRMVCLANSRRLPGRCVAGKEIRNGEIRGWVRPVSPNEGDGLTIAEVTSTAGTEPDHLDLVDVTVVRRAPLDFQTENLVVDTAKRWRIAGKFPKKRVGDLVDSPDELWGTGESSSGGENDRVEESVAIATFKTSLCLICPDTLRLSRRIEWEDPKVRAEFTYRDYRYRLVVTDRRVEADLAARGLGLWEIKPGRVCLCISLGLPYKGFAYKLVAGIVGFAGV